MITQGNGYSITTFSSSYGLKGAVQVDYKWAALEELNSLWNSSLSLPSSSSSLSSSFSMLSLLSHASAALPGSIMREEGPGEMEAIPWFLQDKKDEFVSLKGWHSFKQEQCDDIATIALHPYTLLICPCGFGKSVYFEYFAYLHYVSVSSSSSFVPLLSLSLPPPLIPLSPFPPALNPPPPPPCLPILLIVPTIALKLQCGAIFSSVLHCITFCFVTSSSSQDWDHCNLLITCPESVVQTNTAFHAWRGSCQFPLTFVDEAHLIWSALSFQAAYATLWECVQGMSEKVVEMTGTFDTNMMDSLSSELYSAIRGPFLSLTSSPTFHLTSSLPSHPNPFFPMLHPSCIIIIEIPIHSLPLLKDIFLVWVTAAAAA